MNSLSDSSLSDDLAPISELVAISIDDSQPVLDFSEVPDRYNFSTASFSSNKDHSVKNVFHDTENLTINKENTDYLPDIDNQDVAQSKEEPYVVTSSVPKNARKLHYNLLDYWKAHDQKDLGPLKLLRTLMVKKENVAVSIRGLNFIRSFLFGTLIAFDKHWNLAMQDIMEYFINTAMQDNLSRSEKRRLQRKKNVKNLEENLSKCQKSLSNSSHIVASDSRNVSTSCRSTFSCPMSRIQNRFIRKLLIRGDSIVLVRRLTESEIVKLNDFINDNKQKT